MKFSFLIICIFLCACNPTKPKNAKRFWYYWQTVFDLSPAFQEKLLQDSIDGLYIRMFDVDWNEELNFPRPIGQLDVQQKLDTHLSGIPVVFIKNRVFENIPIEQIDSFAGRLCHKVTAGWNEISPERFFPEIQFDCDWTKQTIQPFFRFLDVCTEIFKGKNIKMSATIRLHQVKYFKETGVPPVNRGMLMFYNMGNLKNQEENNSIYSEEIAVKYLDNLNSYPLPLDVALPFFSQAVIYNNGQISGLASNPSDDWGKINPVKALKKNFFEALEEFSTGGVLLQKGNIIRIERMDLEGCETAAKQLKQYLKNIPRSVAIFDLKSNTYEKENMATVFSLFD